MPFSPEADAILSAIRSAGYDVASHCEQTADGAQYRVSARNKDGEQWTVSAESECAAAAQLAVELGFDDLKG